jgi:hypothetical protein
LVHAIDNHRAVFLVLLDLSAAFDTIDHTVLLQRLSTVYGFSGNVLNWFQSYLFRRTCRVKVGNVYSKQQILDFGLPQGSCVGPKMFSFYTHPIADIIKRYNDVNFHCYAEDTQLYISFDPRVPGESEKALSVLTKCIDEVSGWMAQNMLCLNNDKTEFIIVANPRFLNSLSDISLRVGDTIINPRPHVRNLGVEFDSSLNMSHHVSTLCRSLNFHLRNLSRIRMFIDDATCHHAVRALITSRLDYSNSLLYGTATKEINRLQRLQNRAAKLIFNAPKYDHVSPYLQELHWLPVMERIEFKILVIVFKYFTDCAPSYIEDLISMYRPGRSGLRSGLDSRILSKPKTNLVSAKKGFYAAAPTLWDNLPHKIRHAKSLNEFKKMLKTHLYLRKFHSGLL